MKVSELVKLLQKCEPEATVEFAYENDNTTSGEEFCSVAQFAFFESEGTETRYIVQIRV